MVTDVAVEITFRLVPVKDLIPSPDNPRTIRKGDPALLELAESIKAHGVLQPVVARPHPTKKGKYDLRAGARRHAAAALAGLEAIPAIVRDLSDQEALEITVTENLQREDLLPLEEARGVQILLDRGWTPAVIADHIGKSATWVVRRARLTHLSEKWRKAVEDPKRGISAWPAANLELIARLDAGVQDEVLKERGRWGRFDDPGITAKDLEREIAEYTMDLKKALWRRDDADLVATAGACDVCPKRSSARPGLFDDIDVDDKAAARSDRCLDAKCWTRKLAAFVKRKHAELKKEHGTVLCVKSWGHREMKTGLEKETLSEYDVSKAKKDAKGAAPCLYVIGDKAGSWFWGKKGRERDSLRSIVGGGKKGTGSKPEEPVGDPDNRKGMAEAFADAQVAFTVALALEAEAFDLLGEDKAIWENLHACALWSLAEGLRWGRSSTGARTWLMERLGLLAPEHDGFCDAEACLHPVALVEQLFYNGISNATAALGVFDVLQERRNENGLRAWAPPKALLLEASRTFEVPPPFLDGHTKDDVLIIAGELGVQASKGAKLSVIRKKILDAGLAPGTLTRDLAAAFGVPWKEPPAAEISTAPRKAKKAGKSTPGVCRKCGCTESTPCIDGMGDTCAWADKGRTLCTACAGAPSLKNLKKEVAKRKAK